jgi:hypothetical protein
MPSRPKDEFCYVFDFIGGADEIRTHDLCSAIAALSHLSYSPGQRGVYVPRAATVNARCCLPRGLLPAENPVCHTLVTVKRTGRGNISQTWRILAGASPSARAPANHKILPAPRQCRDLGARARSRDGAGRVHERTSVPHAPHATRPVSPLRNGGHTQETRRGFRAL